MSGATEIVGGSGVGVDARALELQQGRLLMFTQETSKTIEQLQAALLSPPVLFFFIIGFFVLMVEILFGSYFKISGSKNFAKGSGKFIRAMTYFSWISGIIIVFGIGMYFFNKTYIGYGSNVVANVTGLLILAYFINALITGFGGAPSYTILGNFLAIK